MNLEQELYEKIEAYLRDELSGSERIAFEAEIKADDHLSQAVDTMQHILFAFGRKGEQEALEELKAIDKEELHQLIACAKPKKKRYLIWLPAVASIAALLVIAFFIFQPGDTSQQLFYAYYQTEELDIPPSRGDLSDTEYGNQELYRQSIALIEDNKLPEAINNLRLLSSLPDFEYKEEAEWALALAYLKANRQQEAITTLDSIINQAGYYAERAKELKNKMD